MKIRPTTMLVGAVLLITSFLASAAPTTITPNGSFNTLVSPTFKITGGKLVGGNLFHSFSTFNLGTGDTANFIAPTSSVMNIFARVTGGPSTIDGTITSSLGISGPLSKANLFFINPEGVMFTSNAQINLGGSFVVSTANYVKFADGSTFFADTNHPINDSGLSSAPVSAFGFINPTVQPISFTGSQLTAPSGQGIHVIGGDVSLDQGATLFAPSGFVSLFSAAGKGEVPFNLTNPGSGFSAATNTSFGSVSLKNGSYVGIDGLGGGKVVIRGGQLVVDNSTISSANSGSVAGGDIAVQAVLANIQDYGSIQTSTSGTGPAGNISTKVANLLTLDGGYIGSASTSMGNAGNVAVQTGALTIEDTAVIEGTGIFSSLLSPGISSQSNGMVDSSGYALGGPGGNAGNVKVSAAGNMSITSGGEISSSTYTTGNAGNVAVQAGSLYIDNSGSSGMVTDGIFSESDGANNPTTGFPGGGAGGMAGAVEVTVSGNITLTNGGQISSSTFTTGNAGTVTVQAGSLYIDDLNSNYEAGVLSESYGAQNDNSNSIGGAGGDAGAINVTVAGNISISDGGEISTSTSTDGRAGDVTVRAGSLSLDSYAAILSESDGGQDAYGNFVGGTGGNAGAVNVSATGNISITNGAEISSSTTTMGNAGDVTVQAGSLSIDSSGDILSESDGGEDSNGNNTGGVGGNAGDVSVSVAGNISITNEAEISSSTFTLGDAGDVTVQCASLNIAGSESGVRTGIVSESDIAESLGGYGNAGTVEVTTSGSISITNGGEISSNTVTTGNAGKVNVQAGSLYINASLGRSFTGISSISYGSTVNSNGYSLGGLGGNAGTVDVTAPGLVFITNGGQISSNTFTTGNAGDVALQAGSLDIADSNGKATGVLSESDGAESSSGHSLGGAGGNAGVVDIVASNIVLTGHGAISSRTFTTGNAGDVLVLADQVNLDDASIDSESHGTGAGGSVRITANDVDLRDNSVVSASSMISNAGSVEMNIGDTLDLNSGSGIFTASATNGGDITLKVGKLVYLLDGQISAAATDNGGNILIDPEFVVLDDSKITANAAKGQGGNITIITDYYLNENSQITASGATSGTINISAPDLDLGSAMVGLPAALEVAEKRLKEKCAISVKHEYSTLTVVGRGGTESQPEELQSDFGGNYTNPDQPKH